MKLDHKKLLYWMNLWTARQFLLSLVTNEFTFVLTNLVMLNLFLVLYWLTNYWLVNFHRPYNYNLFSVRSNLSYWLPCIRLWQPDLLTEYLLIQWIKKAKRYLYFDGWPRALGRRPLWKQWDPYAKYQPTSFVRHAFRELFLYFSCLLTS